eukprot:CAMPEP_0172546638 /NCGR_PEP_ID=MMETSP1067-20121228/16364_1 /TAXON_ID=265564 ORGANISM="Thalassiosira punctigera, Strain Tpunct2005C2" /NCGR_SAMPLE_ID=MMETSP1067 /ASSEMBLY_ACC=CAM_ASM_000444 /LENGTH=174 /DNA_ID=CAMNT_0013333601 /DNA_START=10 /DNA_END=534 /DNA_ORIENTATION=-
MGFDFDSRGALGIASMEIGAGSRRSSGTLLVQGSSIGAVNASVMMLYVRLVDVDIVSMEIGAGSMRGFGSLLSQGSSIVAVNASVMMLDVSLVDMDTLSMLVGAGSKRSSGEILSKGSSIGADGASTTVLEGWLVVTEGAACQAAQPMQYPANSMDLSLDSFSEHKLLVYDFVP